METHQPNEEQFLSAYTTLNDLQRRAVDTIEGPVMVIAGPGTGKTQILTLRIAQILRQTDTKPENILALTFTKSGTQAMRERLLRLIGTTAYAVPIFTFHSFCEHVIQEYPEAFSKIIGRKPLTDIEQRRVLEQILEDPAVRVLRPVNAPDYYQSALLNTIGSLKQEAVTPDALALIIAQEEQTLNQIEQYHTKGAHKGKIRTEYSTFVQKLEKQRALLTVYRYYEAVLADRRRYDFNDMILETVAVLASDDAIRLSVQEQYQYVLADEHQDVNGAQNKILELITSFHDHPNLFVVGDEKQAIYRFQGASLENFLYFENKFPSTTVISLTDNYRSSQSILDTAQALVAVTEGPLVNYRIPLRSCVASIDTTVVVEEYAHELYEHEAIVARIQSLLNQGVLPHEIAVIVRSNAEVEQITFLLRQVGLAVNPSADADILEHPIFIAVLDLLKAIVYPADEVALARVVQAPYSHIRVEDMVTIFNAVRPNQSLSQILFNNTIRSTLTLVHPESVEQFAEVMTTLREERLVASPHRLVAKALTVTKFLEHTTTQALEESTRVVRRLYDEVEVLLMSGEIDSLMSLVQVLEARRYYKIPLTAPFVPDGVSAIQVMTAHKAKGLEFSVVIIPHVNESTWSGKARRDFFKLPILATTALKLEANEDERRLLYVAMTRAKTQLYLSYATLTSAGNNSLASPFLATIPITVTVVPVPPKLPVLQAVHNITSLRRISSLLVVNVVRRGLSVTALNHLINNPWHFFFRSIIRLPEMKTPALQFGTAMHGVMEFLTKTRMTRGAIPNFAEARSRLQFELERLPLSVTEFTSLFEKGSAFLPAHLEHLTSSLPATTLEERSLQIAIPFSHPDIKELVLKGKIGRIDITADGTVERVVDYKTGKPKSRKALLSQTKDADRSYLRQLAFYALLLKDFENGKYYTPEGTIVFLEPNTRGVITSETFISDSDIQQKTREEIIVNLENFLTGEFIMNDELLETSDYAYVGKLWRDRLLDL